VGGLVVELLTGGFTLDDGTATGQVALQGDAADLLPLIAPGDAINVVGRIESTDRGWTVVVTDPAGVLLAGDTVAADPTSGPAGLDPAASQPASSDAIRSAGLGPFGGLDAGLAGLGTLAALTAASLAVTLLRRRHLQRLFTARMAVRLAAVVGGTTARRGPDQDLRRTAPDGAVGPRLAKHDPRTTDSA
jgi:hypothetical protein